MLGLEGFLWRGCLGLCVLISARGFRGKELKGKWRGEITVRVRGARERKWDRVRIGHVLEIFITFSTKILSINATTSTLTLSETSSNIQKPQPGLPYQWAKEFQKIANTKDTDIF